MTYKLVNPSSEGDVGFVIRRKDDWQEGDEQSYIPKVEDNRNYQEYLTWVAEGNTPEPAE